MKLANQLTLFGVAAVLGAGCVQESAPTVEYFRAHQQERMAQLARCANDPGSLKDSPMCVNAQQAADLERHDSLRDLPSMGLQEQIPPAQADEAGKNQAQ